MSIPTSRNAYLDCFEFMDRAMADPKGARMFIGPWAQANHMRMRMNQARVIDRRESRRIYDKADKLYDISEFDPLVFRIKEDSEGDFWLYAEKSLLKDSDVEALSEVEPD